MRTLTAWDATSASLAPFYDCVSTLPYIPKDVPALALSFDWYSKAWWPRENLASRRREIPGFAELSKRMELLWNDRVNAFMAEPTTLARQRRPKKR